MVAATGARRTRDTPRTSAAGISSTFHSRTPCSTVSPSPPRKKAPTWTAPDAIAATPAMTDDRPHAPKIRAISKAAVSSSWS